MAKQRRFKDGSPFLMAERERRPMEGGDKVADFKDYYEITKYGDIFSKRLGRFIKRIFFKPYDREYLKFQIKSRVYKIGQYQTVADSWFSPEEQQAIASEKLPVEKKAFKHQVKYGTIIYINRTYQRR
jgi:hypothetical protein